MEINRTNPDALPNNIWLFPISKGDTKEYKKYNNFGSYRGYSTFTRHSIKKRITIHLKKRRRAMIWLRQSKKFNNWMNHVLYRPPEKNKKILRYVSVKKSFHNKL